jgi:predicted  nucleic acid-binding Zn-ribbon protein
MKKIIAITILTLAFSFNSNAQDAAKAKNIKTENNPELIQKNIAKDVADIDKTVTLNESLKRDFTTLLNMRAEALSNARTEEDRKALNERFSTKLLGGLTASQLELLKGNKELYNRLTQYSSK